MGCFVFLALVLTRTILIYWASFSFGLGFGVAALLSPALPAFWVSPKVARLSFLKNLQHSFYIMGIWWGLPWAARLQELLNCRHIAHFGFKHLKKKLKNRIREKFWPQKCDLHMLERWSLQDWPLAPEYSMLSNKITCSWGNPDSTAGIFSSTAKMASISWTSAQLNLLPTRKSWPCCFKTWRKENMGCRWE